MKPHALSDQVVGLSTLERSSLMKSTGWLLVHEAAEYLAMHPATVREKMRRRELRAVKAGKVWRTTQIWCDEYLMRGAA